MSDPSRADSPAVTRRSFLQLLGVSVPLLRWRGLPLATPPLLLAQGPRGIWGVTSDASPNAAAFARGARGIHGLQRGAGGGVGVDRGIRGVLGIVTP